MKTSPIIANIAARVVIIGQTPFFKTEPQTLQYMATLDTAKSWAERCFLLNQRPTSPLPQVLTYGAMEI